MTTQPAELAAQVAQTRAFIAADYTEVVLIPRERQATASGGWSYIDGTPRALQRFKLSLLNYDQRPQITIAGGVVRLIDYHLIALPDAVVFVDDYWVDSDGVRFDVVGFSSGRLYELKAFVSCSAPVSAVPSGG